MARRTLAFDPLELLERLAALTPRPRINLVLYYGVLGARSAWRPRLGAPDRESPEEVPGARDASSAHRPLKNRLWALSFVEQSGLMTVREGFGVLPTWPTFMGPNRAQARSDTPSPTASRADLSAVARGANVEARRAKAEPMPGRRPAGDVA
jgi:hypothetical protein